MSDYKEGMLSVKQIKKIIEGHHDDDLIVIVKTPEHATELQGIQLGFKKVWKAAEEPMIVLEVYERDHAAKNTLLN